MGNLIQCEPSRFLEELDPKYIEHAFSIKTTKRISLIPFQKTKPPF